MKKQPTNSTTPKKTVETTASLKNDTHKKDGVQKGYNEKNPTQPQGAFKPDAMNKKE